MPLVTLPRLRREVGALPATTKAPLTVQSQSATVIFLQSSFKGALVEGCRHEKSVQSRATRQNELAMCYRHRRLPDASSRLDAECRSTAAGRRQQTEYRLHPDRRSRLESRAVHAARPSDAE